MVLCFLVSCAGRKPVDVAQEGLEAQLKGDIQTYYSLLSTSSQAQLSLDSCGKAYEELREYIPWVDTVCRVYGFEQKIAGDSSVVTYRRVSPDIERILNSLDAGLGEMLILLGASLFSSDKNHHIQQYFRAKIDSYIQKYGIPIMEETDTIQLVKEKGQWKICIDDAPRKALYNL